MYNATKYMHISIDDINILLKELSEGSYKSIYEHSIINFFKTLHNKYGAVFSFYCFYHNPETPEWTLADITDRFKSEFEEASSWLKFGFHALNSKFRYSEAISPEEALKHYNDTINVIVNFAGASSIDRIPRIHYNAGTTGHARVWRDASCGISGFLAADDNREIDSYLDAVQRSFLRKYFHYFDEKEKLHFFKTDTRLEKVADPYAKLEHEKDGFLEKEQCAKIIFTHECYLKDPAMQKKIEDCCKWAVDNCYTFAYPMQFV